MANEVYTIDHKSAFIVIFAMDRVPNVILTIEHEIAFIEIILPWIEYLMRFLPSAFIRVILTMDRVPNAILTKRIY